MDIGICLKKIRLDRKLTLQDVSGKLNMTASLLSQIENGKITPSLHSLDELLKFYAVNFSEFFRQVEQRKFIVVRRPDIETMPSTIPGVTLSLLASKLQNNALETYIVDMQGGAGIDVATVKPEINGERVIYVLAGSFEVSLDGADIPPLGQGDSLNFKAYARCRVQCAGSAPGIFLIAGLPPLFI